MPLHVALLGDSIFDNRAYTGRQPDVAQHLRVALGAAARVTLLAVDGTTTFDIGPQIDRVSADVTDVILSVGGNDALMHAALLGTPVRSTADALDMFGAAIDAFAVSYRHVLEALTELRKPLTVCTIYDVAFPPPQGSRARVALTMFNDTIQRAALAVGARIVELRDIATEHEDFVNAIEPSGRGGAKIARAIAASLARDGQ